jgi:membrane dipeptidase
MVAYAAKSGLKTIATPKDVDACAAGQPSIVLAAEGADFLEGQIARLDTAYQKGLRQLQLVHYIRNPFGDFQTVRPEFNGLTLAGKQLVEACSAKGILIDLAHSTGSSIDQALDVTKAPMIWSHGWVGESEGRWQDPYGYLQRRLSMSHAKKLAARGGVVALWGLGLQSPAPSWSAGKGSWTVGRGDQRGYARELASLVEQLGVDNVAIGTDMEGVGPDSSVSTYGEVRSVLEHLQDFKLSPGDIEKVAFANYARVLRSVLLT